jgi:hypothetical protein
VQERDTAVPAPIDSAIGLQFRAENLKGAFAMGVSGIWQVFAVGACGGVLMEALRWWNLREAKVLPLYASSPFYWGA